jgi:hypothetical protein
VAKLSDNKKLSSTVMVEHVLQQQETLFSDNRGKCSPTTGDLTMILGEELQLLQGDNTWQFPLQQNTDLLRKSILSNLIATYQIFVDQYQNLPVGFLLSQGHP